MNLYYIIYDSFLLTRAQGVSLVLYPLTAFRAMSRAAATVYASVIRERHQAKVVPLMQTREGTVSHCQTYIFPFTLFTGATPTCFFLDKFANSEMLGWDE
jgi:hypothetical protein